MKIEIATSEMAKSLSEFYRSFLHQGLIEIKIDRKDDFFAPYETQSDRHLTYVLSENQEIEGMATFVIRETLLNNKITNVAFGRDLRISNNRRAIIEWGKHFLPVMEEIGSTFETEYIFSVLSGSEVQAANAFVRPRSMKRPLPHYHLYRRFNLTSLHGRLPWAKNPLPHLSIRPCTPDMEDALIYYVSQKSRDRDLATCWDFDSFADKISRWRGLEITDFLIAVDNHENIVGCVAPWSSYGMQEYIPMEYSLRAHNFRQFLKLGQMFGWTRALTKPVTRLKVEESFKFRYLTFLNADNEDIFESLLWAAYARARKDEFLVYTQTRTEFMYRRPLNWIGAKVPYGVYLMLPPEKEIPNFLLPTNERPIEMEPFFI